jgi:hypothetical protein
LQYFASPSCLAWKSTAAAIQTLGWKPLTVSISEREPPRVGPGAGYGRDADLLPGASSIASLMDDGSVVNPDDKPVPKKAKPTASATSTSTSAASSPSTSAAAPSKTSAKDAKDSKADSKASASKAKAKPSKDDFEDDFEGGDGDEWIEIGQLDRAEAAAADRAYDAQLKGMQQLRLVERARAVAECGVLAVLAHRTFVQPPNDAAVAAAVVAVSGGSGSASASSTADVKAPTATTAAKSSAPAAAATAGNNKVNEKSSAVVDANLLAMVAFSNEGNNAADAFAMATALYRYLKLRDGSSPAPAAVASTASTSAPAKEEKKQPAAASGSGTGAGKKPAAAASAAPTVSWKTPLAWASVFGPPPDPLVYA